MLAIQYLHRNHVLHRDLKPANLFLTLARDLRVGDFGVAKSMACTGEMAHTLIGTPYYVSPEVVKERPYSCPSDIWSMGCILYQMCALRVPFDAADLKSLIQKITKGPAPEIPSEYSTGIRNLCKELPSRDVAKRPQSSEILKRPIVQEMVK